MPRKLYGAQTEAAIKNFPISGWTMPEEFLTSLALIKEHAAVVNGDLKKIPRPIATKIAAAARQIKRGKHLDQFPLDVFQTGSGTSSNMNMNEVVAKLANASFSTRSGLRSSSSGRQAARSKKDQEHSRRAQVHPNDHVNCSQSSNDVIPTALQISAAAFALHDLIPSLEHLYIALQTKHAQLGDIIKTGRTHMMDAVPVRLGDEFGSYATLIGSSIQRIVEAVDHLCDLPLGGTAAGTGINAHPQFAKKVIARMKKETGLPLEEAVDHIAAQSCPFALQTLSSALKETAIILNKIANDIRLMSMGPVAGLSEITLPILQPGSSIMPGKVNPVLCESVEQVAAWVIGSDATVSHCIAQGSRFELNTCMPLIAHTLHTSMTLLSNASRTFADKCIKGIRPNKKVIADKLARNSMLVTALAPEIGYDSAAEIAKEAMRTGETILEIAQKRTKLSKAKLERILDPSKMV